MNRDQLVKVLGMLGSSHDGEVLNAAKKAADIVRTAGLQWGDVIVPDSDDPRPILLDVNRHIDRLSDEDQAAFLAVREKYFNGDLAPADARRIAYLRDFVNALRGDDIPF